MMKTFSLPTVLALAGGATLTILIFLSLLDKGNESTVRSVGSTHGQILVDSPEVYTRERMVNDRFRQEAWLLELSAQGS